MCLNGVLKAMTQTGDYILLQETIFYGAWQAAENLGLKVMTIPEHSEHGLDLAVFKKSNHTLPD
jgi:DNA-binding transcriptional MocR family regulator